MTITLRPALDADAPTLVFLMRLAFQENVGVLVPPSGVHPEMEASARDKMRTRCMGHMRSRVSSRIPKG